MRDAWFGEKVSGPINQRFANSARVMHPFSQRMPLRLAVIGFIVLLSASTGWAFNVVPTGKSNEYLKWGASRIAGTGGGVVTWGFVAAGTPGSGLCGDFCPGESLAALPHFHAWPERDNRTTPFQLRTLQPVFQEAFDAWSAVADIEFQFVDVDASLQAIDDPRVRSPMIRIGVWRFSGLSAYFIAGAAFPPRLKNTSDMGFVFINSNVGFQLSSLPENVRLQDFPQGGGLHMTDLYKLALHEIGHVIGLAGTDDADAVMWRGNPTPALSSSYMWRKPRPDDIAGARFLYGAARRAAAGSTSTGSR